MAGRAHWSMKSRQCIRAVRAPCHAKHGVGTTRDDEHVHNDALHLHPILADSQRWMYEIFSQALGSVEDV